MKNFKNILWGIVLIVVGLMIGGNALGIIDFNLFFRGWWTLFIIVPCFISVFTEKKKTGNIIGVLIGVALLLSAQGIVTFDFMCKLALPTILVILGVSFIFKDVFNVKINEEIKKINEKNSGENDYCATFSEQNVNFDEQEFKGATLNSIFGSVKLDLRKAIILEDQVINATSIFGGIEIFVPQDVKVKIKSSSIFGGVNEKLKDRQETENSKTIYIDASCMFGGVDVK